MRNLICLKKKKHLSTYPCEKFRVGFGQTNCGLIEKGELLHNTMGTHFPALCEIPDTNLSIITASYNILQVWCHPESRYTMSRSIFYPIVPQVQLNWNQSSSSLFRLKETSIDYNNTAISFLFLFFFGGGGGGGIESHFNLVLISVIFHLSCGTA